MKKVKFKVIFVALFMLALLAVGMIPSASSHIASAVSEGNTQYTSVLDDLKKDSAFRSADYPANNQDSKYSLQVIQIAESTAGELFVYTYQPTAEKKRLPATTISISTEINDAFSPKLYSLTGLNAQGVFCKYLVKGFKVKKDTERYYDITEIFRAFDSEIDGLSTGATQSGSTVSEVSFAVGKLYTASTKDGVISYECVEKETIEILNPYHGSLRYMNGFTFFLDKCDSWFVAFSTDKEIERLMAARVYYVSRFHMREIALGVIPIDTYGEYEEEYIDVTDKDKASNNPHGWIKGKPRDWDRIQSALEFIETEKLTSTAKEEIAGKEWVLRFVETSYEYANSGKMSVTRETEISDVSILSLTFETDGKVYKLGAVDNKTTPDKIPDNPPGDQNASTIPALDFITLLPSLIWGGLGFGNSSTNFWDSIVAFFTGHSDWWVYLIVAVVVFLLLPTILGLAIPAVGRFLVSLLKAVGKALLWLLKGLWWLVCLPFKGIAALVRKRRERKDE